MVQKRIALFLRSGYLWFNEVPLSHTGILWLQGVIFACYLLFYLSFSSLFFFFSSMSCFFAVLLGFNDTAVESLRRQTPALYEYSTEHILYTLSSILMITYCSYYLYHLFREVKWQNRWDVERTVSRYFPAHLRSVCIDIPQRSNLFFNLLESIK